MKPKQSNISHSYHDFNVIAVGTRNIAKEFTCF